MAIAQELNESYFIDRFREMGRGEQFTYEGLQALYEHLEQLSEDMGEDIKLDVIGLCCDWYESTLKQVLAEYDDIDVSECEDDDAKREAVLEYLNNETTVIDCGDTFLYAAF